MTVGRLFIIVFFSTLCVFIALTWNIHVDGMLNSAMESFVLFARIVGVIAFTTFLIAFLVNNWDYQIFPLIKKKS